MRFSKTMKLLFAVGLSLLLLFLLVRSTASALVESEMGPAPNKTDAFGLVAYHR